MAKVIVLTNLKGGVGKTTDTDLLSVVASQRFNKKVLLIDVDMQANSTQTMARTYNITEFPKSFTKAVIDNDWQSAILKLSPNLDFIAGSKGTRELNEFIMDNSKNKKERYMFFKKAVEELKPHYDYIFFDVAPSADNTVDAIVCASDYIIPVQEVKRYAMDGTRTLINEYLFPIIKAFPNDVHFQILGVLPALLVKRRAFQVKNYQLTVDEFGSDNVFTTIIKGADRIEEYGENGIQLNDYHDHRVWGRFSDLLLEIEARINSFDKTGDIENFKYEMKFVNNENTKLSDLAKEYNEHGIITAKS